MKSWIVCDLDGTLCDEGHRSQFANAGQWEEYHSLCHLDKPFEDVISILSILTDATGMYHASKKNNDYYLGLGLLIITGRTEKYRELTRQWLTKVQVLPDELLMRPTGSFEKANVLKLQQLEAFFGGKDAALAQVLLVLDDSDKVVQAWRDYGLPCWQVRSRA